MTKFGTPLIADLIVGKLTADVVQVIDDSDAANRVFIDPNLWGVNKTLILMEYRDLAGGQQAIAGAQIIAGEEAPPIGNFLFLRSPQELVQGYMALRLTPTKAYIIGSNSGKVYGLDLGSSGAPVHLRLLDASDLSFIGSGDYVIHGPDAFSAAALHTVGGVTVLRVYPTGLHAATMRPQEIESGTADTLTSTTFTAHANSVGLVFTAPPSGVVRIDRWAGLLIDNLTAAVSRSAYGSWELRTGGTIGSGTITVAASDNNGVYCRTGSLVGIETAIRASAHKHVTGLIGGNTYNVRTMARVSATTSGTFQEFARRLTVTPCM